MSNLPLNINFTQIFLHLLNFLILFAILYFLLYKPVKNFIENREKTYRDMDDKARDNLRESEETKLKYETRMAEAESEISQMKAKSRQEIEKNRDSQIQAAKDEAGRIIREAKEAAGREKEKIISEAQAEILDMVTDATEKLALKASAGEEFDQFLNAVDLAEERGAKSEQ